MIWAPCSLITLQCEPLVWSTSDVCGLWQNPRSEQVRLHPEPGSWALANFLLIYTLDSQEKKIILLCNIKWVFLHVKWNNIHWSEKCAIPTPLWPKGAWLLKPYFILSEGKTIQISHVMFCKHPFDSAHCYASFFINLPIILMRTALNILINAVHGCCLACWIPAFPGVF